MAQNQDVAAQQAESWQQQISSAREQIQLLENSAEAFEFRHAAAVGQNEALLEQNESLTRVAAALDNDNRAKETALQTLSGEYDQLVRQCNALTAKYVSQKAVDSGLTSDYQRQLLSDGIQMEAFAAEKLSWACKESTMQEQLKQTEQTWAQEQSTMQEQLKLAEQTLAQTESTMQEQLKQTEQTWAQEQSTMQEQLNLAEQTLAQTESTMQEQIRQANEKCAAAQSTAEAEALRPSFAMSAKDVNIMDDFEDVETILESAAQTAARCKELEKEVEQSKTATDQLNDHMLATQTETDRITQDRDEALEKLGMLEEANQICNNNLTELTAELDGCNKELAELDGLVTVLFSSAGAAQPDTGGRLNLLSELANVVADIKQKLGMTTETLRGAEEQAVNDATAISELGAEVSATRKKLEEVGSELDKSKASLDQKEQYTVEQRARIEELLQQVRSFCDTPLYPHN